MRFGIIWLGVTFLLAKLSQTASLFVVKQYPENKAAEKECLHIGMAILVVGRLLGVNHIT